MPAVDPYAEPLPEGAELVGMLSNLLRSQRSGAPGRCLCCHCRWCRPPTCSAHCRRCSRPPSRKARLTSPRCAAPRPTCATPSCSLRHRHRAEGLPRDRQRGRGRHGHGVDAVRLHPRRPQPARRHEGAAQPAADPDDQAGDRRPCLLRQEESPGAPPAQQPREGGHRLDRRRRSLAEEPLRPRRGRRRQDPRGVRHRPEGLRGREQRVRALPRDRAARCGGGRGAHPPGSAVARSS